jgi:hypothetical protein
VQHENKGARWIGQIVEIAQYHPSLLYWLWPFRMSSRRQNGQTAGLRLATATVRRSLTFHSGEGRLSQSGIYVG